MADPVATPAPEGPPDRSPAAANPPPVFISHASPDASVARNLVESLERQGIACWIAPRDVPVGALYADAIVRAISAARAFVLILSEHSIHSSHVGREIERASSKNCPILTVRLDAAPLTPALEYFLSEAQWINTQPQAIENACAQLLSALGASAPSSHVSGSAMPESHWVAPSTAVRKRRTGTLITACATICVLAVALYGAKRYGLVNREPVTPPSAATPPVVSEKSIAVLPFTDMSEKHDQEFFGDGMAEEIIDLLTRVPDLRVPARTSSFYFKDKATKLPDIARELRVANVLEGSVRRVGDHLRVTAQLVRADNGYHLWSRTYDRDVHDVFKVQDDIANEVVQALQITLMGGPLTRNRGGTENLDAYQNFLRGRSAQREGTRDSLETGRVYLEQAVKLDPNFGLAWFELGRDVALMTDNGAYAPKDGYGRARVNTQRALELSPELAEAHGLLSYLYRTYDWDWVAADAELQRALAIDPTDSTTLAMSGGLAITLGHWEDAELKTRKALDRDPFFPLAWWWWATSQYAAGHYTGAEATYRKLLEIAPGFAWTRPYLAKTLVAEGRANEALTVIEQETDDTNRLDVLSIVLRAAGRSSEADLALKELIGRFASTDAYFVAMAYAHKGDRDLAIQWLDRAYRQRDASLTEITGEPLFASLAGDPRYAEFLGRMKLPMPR